MGNMEVLPSEIILQITLFLDPRDIVTLQHVCKRMFTLARDNALWREKCFSKSSFLENIRRRQELLGHVVQEPRFRDLARALANGNGLSDSRLIKAPPEAGDFNARSNERIRIMANWDPSYPTERVDWYAEYIGRHSPISMSWLQQPRNRESAEHECLEVRGMGLYTPLGESDSTMVVAPLDDGSVCIWDLSGSLGRKGSIVARSKSGIIAMDNTTQNGSSRPSTMIKTGVTECVSIDSARNKAYIAVRSGLVEVDLETLNTVSHANFPSPITALSEARHPVPLTVGTNLSLYLHDPRATRELGQCTPNAEVLDRFDTEFGSLGNRGSLGFQSLLNPEPRSLYADPYQPGPLSILHLSISANDWDGNGDIYVAGRFPSILNYDRRYFPKLRGVIHSGARLCSMASLPYPFSAMDKDLARRGELSIEQVWEAKTRPGKTLIACGEYNTKGSLEIYGLSPNPLLSVNSSQSPAGGLQNAAMKNRQTCSSSKLLSVSNHGTRIVVSDGGGNLKWLERDGFTEARKWNIANGSIALPSGVFGTPDDSYMESDSGDIALKILNTHKGQSEKPVNEDQLVLWTGEKLGLLSFTSKPGSNAESFEETTKTAAEAHQEREERVYSNTMRRALEHQANEVRFVTGLGLRFGGR